STDGTFELFCSRACLGVERGTYVRFKFGQAFANVALGLGEQSVYRRCSCYAFGFVVALGLVLSVADVRKFAFASAEHFRYALVPLIGRSRARLLQDGRLPFAELLGCGLSTGGEFILRGGPFLEDGIVVLVHELARDASFFEDVLGLDGLGADVELRGGLGRW